MKKYPLLTSLFLISSIAPTSAAPQCTIEHARYEAMDKSQWTVGFRQIPKGRNWLTNVAFYVQSGASKRRYWFLFDAGSGRYVHLLSTTDVVQPGWHPRRPDDKEPTLVAGDMDYFPIDAQMGVSLTIPSAGEAPPVYIFLPDLQETMWYDMADPMKREHAPLAFFKLSSCDSN